MTFADALMLLADGHKVGRTSMPGSYLFRPDLEQKTVFWKHKNNEVHYAVCLDGSFIFAEDWHEVFD